METNLCVILQNTESSGILKAGVDVPPTASEFELDVLGIMCI